MMLMDFDPALSFQEFFDRYTHTNAQRYCVFYNSKKLETIYLSMSREYNANIFKDVKIILSQKVRTSSLKTKSWGCNVRYGVLYI